MERRKTATCPYSTFPPASNWYKSVSGCAPREIDPCGEPTFQITRETRIATAGSCFAQNIARALSANGFTHFLTEKAPGFIPADLQRRFGYGIYSARYGNIYTVRQLLQLALRAFGMFKPAEPFWRDDAGYVDPFRPAIQPGGYDTPRQALRDRIQHMDAVRRMFLHAEIIVFTMGLTEAWRSLQDGAVFPVCPGCGNGAFDAAKYEFHNFDYDEILDDFKQLHALIKARNPGVKFLLTISPVPLVATASGDHVLNATVYSKSVLRAAAGKLSRVLPDVHYFPSYEVVTSPAAGGRYFTDDLRTVTQAGIAAVMELFFKHFASHIPISTGAGAAPAIEMSPPRAALARQAALVCEEEMLNVHQQLETRQFNASTDA